MDKSALTVGKGVEELPQRSGTKPLSSPGRTTSGGEGSVDDGGRDFEDVGDPAERRRKSSPSLSHSQDSRADDSDDSQSADDIGPSFDGSEAGAAENHRVSAVNRIMQSFVATLDTKLSLLSKPREHTFTPPNPVEPLAPRGMKGKNVQGLALTPGAPGAPALTHGDTLSLRIRPRKRGRPRRVADSTIPQAPRLPPPAVPRRILGFDRITPSSVQETSESAPSSHGSPVHLAHAFEGAFAQPQSEGVVWGTPSLAPAPTLPCPDAGHDLFLNSEFGSSVPQGPSSAQPPPPTGLLSTGGGGSHRSAQMTVPWGAPLGDPLESQIDTVARERVVDLIHQGDDEQMTARRQRIPEDSSIPCLTSPNALESLPNALESSRIVSQTQPEFPSGLISLTSSGRGGRGRRIGGARNEATEGDHDGRRKKARQVRSGAEVTAEARKFACPYFQRNPRKYSKWTSCPGPGWDEVHRVKTHLYRRHALPPQCPRCWAPFDTDAALSDHLQQDPPCTVSHNLTLSEGFTKDQEKKLRSRKKTRADMTDEDKWKEIYAVLFPDDDPSSAPSAYYGSKDEDEVPPLADFEGYATFVRREMPSLVRRELEAMFDDEYRDVEKRVRPRVAELVLHLQPRLLQLYRQNSSNSERSDTKVASPLIPSSTEPSTTPATMASIPSSEPLSSFEAQSIDCSTWDTPSNTGTGSSSTGTEAGVDWDATFNALFDQNYFSNMPVYPTTAAAEG